MSDIPTAPQNFELEERDEPQLHPPSAPSLGLKSAIQDRPLIISPEIEESALGALARASKKQGVGDLAQRLL